MLRHIVERDTTLVRANQVGANSIQTHRIIITQRSTNRATTLSLNQQGQYLQQKPYALCVTLIVHRIEQGCDTLTQLPLIEGRLTDTLQRLNHISKLRKQ